MASKVCRLCCSSSTLLTSTIEDQLIKELLVIADIELKNDKFLPNNVCQLCYGKAKIAKDFISKIKSSQDAVGKKFKAGKLVPRVEVVDVFKKLQKVGEVSIRKLKPMPSPEPSENMIYLKTEIPDLEPECELLEEIAAPNREFSHPMDDDDNDDDDDDDFACDASEDDDYTANPIKKTTTKRSHQGTTKSQQEFFLDAPIKYTCSKCRAIYDDYESLAEHNKAKECTIIECETCERQFTSKKQLYNHKKTHLPKERFVCEICAKTYSTSFDLDNHIEAEHRRVIKEGCTFKCSTCSSTFFTQFDLLEHMKEHMKERKESPRFCEICGRQCTNLKSYQAHLLNHKKVKSFTCTVCNRGFLKSFLLLQHMHIHTGIKSFSCDVCPKSYAKKESLRIHKRKDHGA